jgi:hypothetical protein
MCKTWGMIWIGRSDPDRHQVDADPQHCTLPMLCLQHNTTNALLQYILLIFPAKMDPKVIVN